MRLIITSDLHWNHPRSRPSAQAIISRINARADVDALLVLGDVGVADGDSIEACLGSFTFGGPKLFVPGNHDLWSKREDPDLLHGELPRRLRAIDWTWLPHEPFVRGDVAVVGSIGWYDYSFADGRLQIPLAFYAAKASPGAVLYTGSPLELVAAASDCPAVGRDLVARWNDGKFVRLGMSDAELVEQECERLRRQLGAMQTLGSVVVATHTVPLAQLLPPHHGDDGVFGVGHLHAAGRLTVPRCPLPLECRHASAP